MGETSMLWGGRRHPSHSPNPSHVRTAHADSYAHCQSQLRQHLVVPHSPSHVQSEESRPGRMWLVDSLD